MRTVLVLGGRTSNILTIIFAVILPFLILLGSLRLVAYDFDFYQREFLKLGVYEELGREVADEKGKEILNFLNSGGQLGDFFSERAKLHMNDVRNLLNSIFMLLNVLLGLGIIILILLFKKKTVFRALIYGGIFAIFILLAAGSLFVFNFQSAFLKFHNIAFKNEYWMLEASDTLVRLFPAAFFYDAGLRILIYGAILALIFVAIGIGGILGMKRYQAVT